MGKVMTVGEILVEIMATERGQSLRRPGSLVGPFPSGAPAIFIDQVGKLGQPSGIIGCVGDDEFGWLNIERLRQDGVDTAAITVLGDAVTGSAFVTYEKTGERHFVFNIVNSASGRLSASSITEEALHACTRFHVMGSSLFSAEIAGAVHKASSIVKQQGGMVSFDPNIRQEMLGIPGMREALTAVLPYTDVFLPSADEVTLLVGAATESSAIDQLLSMGIQEIVVKRGRQGCTYFGKHRRLDVPAFTVREVDPTGAGDCFCGTYVTCRERGMPVEQALRYACASGALAVTRMGPMEGTSGFAELEELMRETSTAGLQVS
jgi:sugar/nucleoside kinase (ribokinase family)